MSRVWQWLGVLQAWWWDRRRVRLEDRVLLAAGKLVRHTGASVVGLQAQCGMSVHISATGAAVMLQVCRPLQRGTETLQ